MKYSIYIFLFSFVASTIYASYDVQKNEIDNENKIWKYKERKSKTSTFITDGGYCVYLPKKWNPTGRYIMVKNRPTRKKKLYTINNKTTSLEYINKNKYGLFLQKAPYKWAASPGYESPDDKMNYLESSRIIMGQAIYCLTLIDILLAEKYPKDIKKTHDGFLLIKASLDSAEEK